MSIELVMPSNHLILCHPLLLPPSICPSIRVLSHESALCIRWPNYWSFSISPSNEYSDWFPLGLTGLISLQSKGLARVFSSITVQKHQFFGTQLSLWPNSHIHSWLLENYSFEYVLLSYPKGCYLFLAFQWLGPQGFVELIVYISLREVTLLLPI